MKSNPDYCKRNSTTRSISEFISQVVRESPLRETGVSSLKKARTAPYPLPVRRDLNSTLERRRDGRKLGKHNLRRHTVRLFAPSHGKEMSGILPRFQQLTYQESPNQAPTDNQTVSSFVNITNQSKVQTDSSMENLFPMPTPPYANHKPNFSDSDRKSSMSISEFIGKVIDKSPEKLNNSLRIRNDSVGDWIKSVVRSTPQERDVENSKRRKRNKKLVSEGFAEYIRLLSRRVANDAHLWYHSVKRESHLEGVDSSAIITAFVSSIRVHGPLYTMLCSLGEPIPENITENDHYQEHGKITIIFSHQTVEMLRITQKSCVKICPPWTLLPIRELNYPVILCTYFSFLSDSAFQHTDTTMQTDQLIKAKGVTSLWKSVGSQDARHSRFASALVDDESTMDAELCLKEHSLTCALKSQRWEDLTLAGNIVHVTHSVNPHVMCETDSMELRYFHVFVQDITGHISLVTLPERILDAFSNIKRAHQLMNNSVILSNVRIVSRENKLTAPGIMSVVQTLSDQDQRFCYCLAANTNVKLSMFTLSFSRDCLTSKLAKLSLAEEPTAEKRFSLAGKLLHTQLETPQRPKEWETDEDTRPMPGAYLFFLGTNSILFQVYLDPILSHALLSELNQSIGKLLYLSSLYRAGVTERPNRIQGDQYSLLLELDQTGLWLGRDEIEGVRDRCDQIDPPPFSHFDRNSTLWSMVRVKGRITDVVDDTAYVYEVCDRCEEGVEEYSQSNELYCDECQRFVTHPISKYNFDIMVECEGTELVIHLHETTIKALLLPLLRNGKLYDKNDLKGKEIELESCFIQESRTLPAGSTKVFLEQNIQ